MDQRGIFRSTHHTITALVFLSPFAAAAAEVSLHGMIGAKALLVIDGGRPRLFAAGETSPEGVKLIRVDENTVVVENDGRRHTLTLGGSIRLASPVRGRGVPSVTLTADGQGHFVTTAAINGITVRVLVDTGATLVSMSSIEAKRLGIDFTAGRKAYSSTANGVVPAYRVKINEVRLGDIVLRNVDGMVHVGNALPVVLLGMSFLSRMDMRREGDRMVLTKRY